MMYYINGKVAQVNKQQRIDADYGKYQINKYFQMSSIITYY